MTTLSVGFDIAVAGRPAPEQHPQALIRDISGSYFAAMGIPLLAGRTFSDTDTGQAPPVAVVNQTLARRFFAGENPIGQHLILDTLSRARGRSGGRGG